ncbi:hypothetical protein NMY22_g3341 [Coprinellus aureogranulatus]|nr:hypothetical protein NMY22_g3341 [Coprinellus aureogranulatus]
MTTLEVFCAYPIVDRPFGAMNELRIDLPTLIINLNCEDEPEKLYISCASLTTLHIFRSDDCPSQLTNKTAKKLFSFLLRLTRLEKLTIYGSILPTPYYPPAPPTNMAHTPLRIGQLSIRNAHGDSLSFLLQHIQPRKLTLDSCSVTSYLPNCHELELHNIPVFGGSEAVLLAWSGVRLTIHSCGFLNDTFITHITNHMLRTGEPVWPNARVEFHDYPPALESRLSYFEGVRSGLQVAHAR